MPNLREIVKNCKYLGIEMYLKCNDHIKLITNKLKIIIQAFKNVIDLLELQKIRV